MGQRIPHTRLCTEMNNVLKAASIEQVAHGSIVG
jgi:hypothetical protein